MLVAASVLALRLWRALLPAPRPGGRCPGRLGQLILSHWHPTARTKLALLPSLQPEEEHAHVFLHQLRGLHLRAGPDHLHHAHLQARPGEPCPSAPRGHAAGRASLATSVPGTPGKSRCSFGFTFPAPACALPSSKPPWVCLELSLQAESSTPAPKEHRGGLQEHSAGAVPALWGFSVCSQPAVGAQMLLGPEEVPRKVLSCG